VQALKTLPAALVALAVLAPHTRAQGLLFERSLPISLFERYLEVLRQQAGIPGLSAAIVQSGRIAWDRGFGYREVEGLVSATADTAYPILDLSQTLAATVLLQQCLELRYLELTDRVRRWHPQFPEETTTVAQLLSHTGSDSSFRYDTSRYANLTTVSEQCTSTRYPVLLTREVLDRLGMNDSVPGHDLADGSANRRLFSSSTLDRYGAVLERVAPPYKVDGNRRASRSDYSRPSLSASTGIVSTVRDLARFDAGLDVLLAASTRERAWQVGSTPMGLGWFVQQYNGERIVWHFGMARDAYSALYIKVPGRELTLLLLANSDGLAEPYNLPDGNVTSSLFARAFLQLFVS
jgi:CubicO group peptidase (beta-lactamase class C family)